MKKLLLRTALLFLISHFSFLIVKAQWVSIPDTNFGTWLNTNGYIVCMQGNNQVGWQMDTTCPAVVGATSVACINKNIHDLTGIQYFNSLQGLACGNNELSTIPALPNSLTGLNCEDNPLTSLPALPNSLENFDCDRTQLTVLPTLPNSLTYLSCWSGNLSSLPVLPGGLTYLGCGDNQLVSLPALPVSLNDLYCSNNQLTSLPTLPSNLWLLDCPTNQLTSLPTLPNNLNQFSCAENNITSLPTLPNSLATVNCSSNPLGSLPTLPNSITALYCSNNNLSSLPSLPNNLGYLDCWGNNLSTLPALPNSLGSLYCSSNNLSSLPDLPDFLFTLYINDNPALTCLPPLKGVRYFYFTNTGITCLPNYPQSNLYSDPPLNSVPLCDVFNANGCDVYWNIMGRTYYDGNNNCIKDGSDTAQGNVKVYLRSGGNLLQQVYTGTDGYYSYDTDSFGIYNVSADTANLPFYVSCPANNLHYDTITAIDSFDYNKDFALRCKPGFDLTAQSISAIRFRPANFTTVNIHAGDFSNFYGVHCAMGVSGSVTISINGPVSYISPASGAIAPSSISGNILTYSIADFGTANFNTDFNIIVQTDTTAPIGSLVCFTVSVTPTTGDNYPANNTLTHCFTVVGSFDPNDKQVSPSNIVDTSGWLTYTINFQNTGTDTAQHVYVTDTLDTYLDESSFQLLAYSVEPMVQINENAVRFNFPNINLPDSNVNEPASHGYVQYKVKLQNGLDIGTQIDNTAFIYFDFNAPVVTNTVTNFIQCTPFTTYFSAQICAGESYLFNGVLLDTAGIYVVSLLGGNGCDSVIELTLIEFSPSFTGIGDGVCENELYNFNGVMLSDPGLYYDTLTNMNGCDSVVALTLYSFSSSFTSLTQSTCAGDTIYFGNNGLIHPGIYTDTLQNVQGCDSVVLLDLVVLPVYAFSVDTTIVQGTTYTLPSGNVVGTPGAYSDTLISGGGCDSIIVTNLSVLSGVEKLRIADLGLRIFPNPATSSVTISIDERFVGSNAVISDCIGRKVANLQLETLISKLETRHFAKGVYLITILHETESKVVKKLVIE